VPPVPASADAAPAGPPVPASPESSIPALSTKLGIEGSKRFVIQHQLFSRGHNYRILDETNRHLFTIEEDVSQELELDVLYRSAPPPPSDSSSDGILPPPPALTLVWKVVDPSGAPQAQISIQVTGNATVSTLSDAWGTTMMSVTASRGLLGDLSASATFPDGRTMFQGHGNLLSHDFAIQDPAGTEVARVREAWVSASDSYGLEIVGNLDPLPALVFAILIDREKRG
jgi:hypothetical protein